MFGISKLRPGEMPYFGAKDPCVEPSVQLSCNQYCDGLPDLCILQIECQRHTELSQTNGLIVQPKIGRRLLSPADLPWLSAPNEDVIPPSLQPLVCPERG